MTRIPVRILVGGLAAGLAVTGTAYAVLPDSTPPTSETLTAQAQALPSPLPAAVPARPVHRASRGGTRSTVPPMTSVTRTVATGATFSGEASWYGGYFQGRRTASGERFNTYDLTAASKTLPFGTRLRVCRRGTCVVVRVNDRGPYVGSRVLDLSQAAAQRLGYSGVAQVTATPVGVRTVSVVDVAEVGRLRAVDRRAAVARRQAAHAAQLRTERARAAQVAVATVQAASSSPLENAWPSVAAAAGLLLAGSGGLVHARRRRSRP